MGARVVFNLKQSDSLYLCLYSHWGATQAREDLANALAKAESRWNDEAYCARIIVSQLVGEDWASELGFGLWASTEPCVDEEYLNVDLGANTVTTSDGEFAFASFATFYAGANA